MTDLLSQDERETQLAPLFANGWTLHETSDAIVKTFVFKDFIAAFGFMTQAALRAEKHNHHPEWRNVYNRVEVTLTTHEADGLTTSDITLALTLDKFAEKV
jgi:4a-hydroxytetrahydrobiopterin dehydratase